MSYGIDWHKIFIYKDGKLFRKNSSNKHKHVGWKNSSGYIQTEYNGVCYMVHRIIYEMHFDDLTSDLQIDHKDINPLNNRIDNLRVATQSQNQVNSKAPKNSSTGVKVVHLTPSGKYQARFGHKGKKLYIGLYDTIEEADKACKEKRKELHDEFASDC